MKKKLYSIERPRRQFTEVTKNACRLLARVTPYHKGDSCLSACKCDLSQYSNHRSFQNQTHSKVMWKTNRSSRSICEEDEITED